MSDISVGVSADLSINSASVFSTNLLNPFTNCITSPYSMFSIISLVMSGGKLGTYTSDIALPL